MPPSSGAAPAQFSDLAPGDTAGVITMMRQVMQRIDAGLPSMTERDTLLASIADSQSRRLAVWLEGATVRKLVVSDSSGNGPGTGETDVWFLGGDVAVVQQVSDVYAFDAGRIVLWTDGSLEPRTDVTPDMIMIRESALIDRVRQWLAVLGIPLP
ncbi:MAG: hypothetical protein ACREK8_00335 [Gemmatimonadales bacterium]